MHNKRIPEILFKSFTIISLKNTLHNIYILMECPEITVCQRHYTNSYFILKQTSCWINFLNKLHFLSKWNISKDYTQSTFTPEDLTEIFKKQQFKCYIQQYIKMKGNRSRRMKWKCCPFHFTHEINK